MTERAPQELAQKLLDEYRAFGAGYAGISITPELLGQLCTALTAALDANREMLEAIRNWSNAHAAVTWIDDDVDSADDALHDIATTPPTGLSLRAELAELKKQVRDCLASPDCDLRNCETLGALL